MPLIAARSRRFAQDAVHVGRPIRCPLLNERDAKKGASSGIEPVISTCARYALATPPGKLFVKEWQRQRKKTKQKQQKIKQIHKIP